MSDPWINKLVVSGLVADVEIFQQTAATGEGQSRTSLSFTRLQEQLPDAQQHALDEPVEPWDDWNDSNPDGVGPPAPRERPEPGMMDLIYNFSLERYEPDPLLVRASMLFPRLCFVLGWVAPSNDEHTSRFIHNGHTLVYHASPRQVETLRDQAYRRHGLSIEAASEAPMDDDNALAADVEGDWALLAAVVKHWEGKVARTLARVQTSAPLSLGTSQPCDDAGI